MGQVFLRVFVRVLSGDPSPLNLLENSKKKSDEISSKSGKFSSKFRDLRRKSSKSCKICKILKKSKNFDIRDFSFGAYLVDLVKRFPTSI